MMIDFKIGSVTNVTGVKLAHWQNVDGHKDMQPRALLSFSRPRSLQRFWIQDSKSRARQS
jgi:hypothetical protein